MGNKLQFNDTSPLDILIRTLMCLNWGIFQHGGVLNPSQHKVSKLTRLAVEGAGVPAQASVQ